MILDLVYPEKSEISYKISKFPDGQQTIDLKNLDTPLIDKVVVIKSRLNSFRDLELIVCAKQALDNLDATSVRLYVPYFLGARSDRQFQPGGSNYLKQVICPIINAQKFSNVTVMDPHSDVLEACIEKYKKISNFSIVKYALSDLVTDGQNYKIGLISPDAGALKKIYDVAKHFAIENVTVASKIRNVITGEIIRTEVPTMDLSEIEHFLIIDDICDGGRTFIELAKEVRKQTDKPIYLVVTHGIFSNGFEELKKHINGIFCTNSISDIEGQENYINQLNVF